MTHKMIRHLVYIHVAIACLAVTSVTAQEPSWRAGVATAVVTPEQPMWMAGYASRNRPSEGAVHDLFVKALALESVEGKRLVIVSMDLISVPYPLRSAVEAAVGEKFGLPPEGLLINCSHTHCGPEIRTTRWSQDGLPAERLEQAIDYANELERKLIGVVGEALEDLTPARLAYCRARCGFAMNRRMPSPAGFRNFPNPDGPIDHDVPVLRVDRPDGTLKAIVFGYACHNTTLSFYKFCGDYAGFAQQYLETDHPGTTALFLTGCGGDQNPYPRRSLELAQQHGRSLANSVETALETQPTSLTGPLRLAYDKVTVEYRKPPSRENLEQQARAGDKYDRLHAQRLLRQLDEDGHLREEYDCPVQLVRFGDELLLVALPGETVVDYSIRLKRELPAADGSGPAVWVAGYSNDVFAYIPSRRVLLEGGYEAGGAMRYMTTVLQPGPFAPSIEERLISKVRELTNRLGG